MDPAVVFAKHSGTGLRESGDPAKIAIIWTIIQRGLGCHIQRRGLKAGYGMLP